MKDRFMSEAIKEAKKGLAEGGIPIGSVLVKNDEIVGRGRNKRIQDSDPTAHAEIECIRNTGRIKNYNGAIIYSTLMPCYMCAGAIIQFGIKKVIAGESRNFEGAEELLKAHGVEVINLDDESCIEMMAQFIQKNPDVWNEDIGISKS